MTTRMIQLHQGRSQELEMGGAKLLGEGSGGRLMPPVGPGQRPGGEAPGSSWILAILGVKFNQIISPHRWLHPLKKTLSTLLK